MPNSTRLVIIVTNLAPVAGILFLGWDAFAVVFLYWAENVVIGMFNALKILMAHPGADATMASMIKGFPFGLRNNPAAHKELTNMPAPPVSQGLKIFLVPFFMFHYGLFTLVHGVFVVVLFANGGIAAGGGLHGGFLQAIQPVIDAGMIIAVLCLAAEHGHEFFSSFWRGGEYKRTHPMVQMFKPYGRIIVLHLVIMAAGFLFVFLRLPRYSILLLVAFKIWYDLRRAKAGKSEIEGHVNLA